MKSNLYSLFNPKSLVLIGASSKPGSIGYEILKSIINFNYQGKIFVINPNAEEILGIKCHSSLSQISEPTDLAIILTPKKFVIQNLNECAQAKIKNVIVITAGFKEVGAEGKELENELIRIAKENSIRLVGPNCMGIINTEPTVKLNATFVAEMPKYSKVGFLSQSGSLAAAVLNTLSETGFSFNQFISVGNKADINENDVLEYWIEDEKINVITMYLESFEKGREFFELAKQVSHQKPILILKAARYEYGIKAASSHTGALASKDVIIDTMLKQAGIIRVNTIEEMFETADAFQKFSLPNGNRVVIITNAGGAAILCVDECEKLGFTLSQLEQSTKEKIKPLLVPEASLNNPIDMLPSADGDVFKKVTEIVLEDSNVDAVIVIYVEPIMTDAFDVISKVSQVQKQSKKPVLISCFPLPKFWNKWKNEGDTDSIIYNSVELPPKILKNLLERKWYLEKYNLKSAKEETQSVISDEKLNYIEKLISKSSGGYLTQESILKISKTLKLPTVKSAIVKNFAEAKNIVGKLNFPLVLKINSDEITHKSDVGGVITNIQNQKELKSAFESIESNLRKKKLLNKINGYLIQEQVHGGVEVIIGGFRDENFGPVIMFGAGGKLVELIKDSNFLLTPVNYNQAEELILRSKIYKILKGYRGERKYDLNYLSELIVLCSELLYKVQRIKEFDLNPLILKPKSSESKIVDLRIKI